MVRTNWQNSASSSGLREKHAWCMFCLGIKAIMQEGAPEPTLGAVMKV